MKADYIFYNGNILTIDPENNITEALAVKKNKILSVGKNEEILEIPCDTDKKIDLKGRTLMPGIIDAHIHSVIMGLNANAIDLRPSKVKSIDDIKRLIREVADKTPKGEWIRGWGYNHMMLEEKRHPNKYDLDEVAPENPVILTRVCSHISTHNSKSLELAGISSDTSPPDGGDFEIIGGEISGVMFENAHMEMLKTSQPSQEEFVNAIQVANDMLISQGITSIHDSGGYGAPQMYAFQEAIEKDILKLRLYAMIFSFIDNTEFIDEFLGTGIYTRFGNEKFKLGPIKIMIDGSSSGPTAATIDPYTSDPSNNGIMSMTRKEIDSIVMKAHKAGWQVTCHTIGDKAVTTILDALEKSTLKYPRADCRHRVEHCAMMNDNLIDRVKKIDIIPIPQSIFLYEFGDGYKINYGDKRTDMMFPCETFRKNGILAANSTDCPITYSNPFLNIYMAVNRKTQTGQTINPEECVGIMDAIRMSTINGAYASFEEKIKGSLEPGKLADLIVLDRDILQTDKEKIKDINVQITMIDGEIVYTDGFK